MKIYLYYVYLSAIHLLALVGLGTILLFVGLSAGAK